VILLGNQSLPPDCECRIGPDDYFVQMQSIDLAFGLFGTVKWSNFVLRKTAALNGAATLQGEAMGPGDDDIMYHVEARPDQNGFTLVFITPRLACTPVYKIHFTRITLPSGRASP
jgi:hypothetical protein